ncbi:MAG: PAS domain-containing protein, partial [Betaproteobacteria bacterium]
QTIRTLGLRTRFEQALGAREQRHRELVEDQSELVSLAREDGTLVYVNQAFARHFARTPAELVGTDRHDLFDAGERESMRMEGSAVLRTGRERHGENRMTGADGSERWVAWMNKRRQDPEGTLLHSVGRDITERKRAERALRASQAFLHRTSALAGIGGWELDLATGVAVWSEHVRRILEVDDDYVPSRADAVASYAPEARETVERAMADCVERGVAWDLELPRSTGSGRRIWVRTVGSLELERGQPRRIVGALQDITERKLLEQRLADGERFLHQVTDSLPVRIAYLDAHSRYRFVNLAHCRLYEKTRAEIIGRTHAQLADGRPNSQVDAHVAAVLRGTPQKFEYEEMQDGALRRIEAQLMPDVDAHGNARGFYSIGVDITERVANETQLRDLTQIIELSPDLILQSDHLGVVNYMNPALRRAIGIGPTEPPGGRRVGDFTTDETHRLYLREVQPALRTAGWWLGETTLTLADGRVTPVNHLVIAHREANGQVRRLSTVLRDIADQVAARNALQLQTATLRTVTEALPAMVAIVGKDGCYRFVNSAFERWTGLPREQLLGRRVADVIEPDDLATRQPWIDRVLAGESVSFETSDPTRPVKHLGVTYIPLHDADGGVDGYVGVAQDITPHKEETGRLMELTQRDALTGLLNRPGLERWLVQRDAEAAAGTLALLYVDLDHFKPVNDSFGHPAGDAVLREFALRLQGLVRPADAVARLGGDEFAVALAGVRERLPAQAIAEKIVAAAARPFIFAGIEIHVGASVGVAFQPDGAGGAQALVAYADDMLYKAKAAGRGTVA